MLRARVTRRSAVTSREQEAAKPASNGGQNPRTTRAELANEAADRFEEQGIGNRTLLIAVWKRYQGVYVTLRAELDDDHEEQW